MDMVNAVMSQPLLIGHKIELNGYVRERNIFQSWIFNPSPSLSDGICHCVDWFFLYTVPVQ